MLILGKLKKKIIIYCVNTVLNEKIYDISNVACDDIVFEVT